MSAPVEAVKLHIQNQKAPYQKHTRLFVWKDVDMIDTAIIYSVSVKYEVSAATYMMEVIDD